jgi:hypothetical protein
MALSRQQINQLLDQGRAAGMNATELASMREFLIDRAAEMDGATRLDNALAQLPEADREAAEAFVQDMGAIRGDIMQRGADDVLSMSDEEWEGLIGE